MLFLFFFIFKHLQAPNRSWKIIYRDPGKSWKSPGFFVSKRVRTLCEGKRKGSPILELMSIGGRSWSLGSQPAGDSHEPGARLPLLSARPAVTFPAWEHHRPLASTKLYYYTNYTIGDRSTCVWTTCPESLPGGRTISVGEKNEHFTCHAQELVLDVKWICAQELNNVC